MTYLTPEEYEKKTEEKKQRIKNVLGVVESQDIIHVINTPHPEVAGDFLETVARCMETMRRFSPPTFVRILATDMLSVKKHELDITHSRECYKCKKELRFIEVIEANRQIPMKQLKKLWKHPAIQFYCCQCYNHEMVREEMKKVRKQMEEKMLE